MKPSIVFSLVLAIAALAGCASPDNGLRNSSNASAAPSTFAQGMPQDQLRQIRGEPFAIYTYPEGSSWFYNVAIRDMQRDRVDFDAQGLLISAGPAWNRSNFERVQPQVWTSAQLQQNFGPPQRQDRLRASILDALGDAPAPVESAEAAEERASSRNWIYGFREYNRYFIVSITVNAKGLVTAIKIEADPNNTTM
ncbi:hypothetical protein [Lampropedia aestuarii]|uniref:hypothetical protein n=1 Tax=Lampropedia aestuarii TaxID=2562762 RepID=UPI0024695DCD|nr:hypothetical protein [Lampropedia aestuarii]MDH5856785.1 hypothetical protein [Lampropedia aestuarii]